VLAVDLGEPTRRTGSVQVELVVVDANDHAPAFNRSSYAASVLENAPAD